MSDVSPKHCKVYAAGFYDGLRKSGIEDVEGFMNAARLKQVENGLSGIARKVLEAVPIADQWPAHTIANEIKRATGSAPEIKIVNGCLESLKSSGLVREPTRGKWIRVSMKDHADADEMPAPVKVVELRKQQPEQTAREMLSQVAIAMMDLAAKVEDVASEIDKAEKRNEEKTAKLRQLQELLRGLGQ